MYLLLLCFLINSAVSNKDNLINLEALDYYSTHTFTGIRITFRSFISGMHLKVKCPKHVKCIGDDTLECGKREAVQLDIELTNRIANFVVPFTVLCTSNRRLINTHFIDDLEISHDDKRIYSGWRQTKTGSFFHYLIVCTSNVGDIEIINTTDNALILSGIKDQTWYQVCVANVEKGNKQSTFTCARIFFDRKKLNPNSYTNPLSVNKMKAFSREQILKYKSDEDIISELVTLNLSHVNLAIVSKEDRLNISWNITNGMRGSIFEYVLLLKTQSNVCEYAIYFICSDCASPLNSSFLTQTDQDKIYSYGECYKNFTEQFDIHKISFYYVKSFNKTLSNVKGEFYAINFLGVHSIKLKQTTLMSNFANSFAVPLVLCLLIILTVYEVLAQIVLYVF